ncbi:MAG TPA: alpha/beta fold hydrolase [Candidatus Kapabacteria bacterium]|nr:alpha/beta fold hydrolase [Candidatus Kapabacteria bacterium]
MNDIVQVLRKAKKANQHEQIVMFPFGGGSGYSYSALVNQIGEDVEVIVINPPGHFFNSGKALESIDAMVYLYTKELRRFLKNNPIFFGHSIGGIVAYELCKILEKDFHIKRLIISSVNPPHSTMELVDLRSWMDTETLIQKCTDLGGMPHIFKQEPELLESFINGLRADLKALESYTPPTVENVVKSLINATVLYSDRDYIVNASQVREWKYYLDCPEFRQFPGDHFYLFDSPNLSSVAQLLANYVKND